MKRFAITDEKIYVKHFGPWICLEPVGCYRLHPVSPLRLMLILPLCPSCVNVLPWSNQQAGPHVVSAIEATHIVCIINVVDGPNGIPVSSAISDKAESVPANWVCFIHQSYPSLLITCLYMMQHLSVSLSICLSVHLSVCLSVCFCEKCYRVRLLNLVRHFEAVSETMQYRGVIVTNWIIKIRSWYLAFLFSLVH